MKNTGTSMEHVGSEYMCQGTSQFLGNPFYTPFAGWHFVFSVKVTVPMGPSQWLSGNESACQFMTRGFNPWVRKNP